MQKIISLVVIVLAFSAAFQQTCVQSSTVLLDANVLYINPSQTSPSVINWSYVQAQPLLTAANYNHSNTACITYRFSYIATNGTFVSFKNWTQADNSHTAGTKTTSYSFPIDQAVSRAWKNDIDVVLNLPTYYYQFRLQIYVNDILQQTWTSSYYVVVDITLESVKQVNALPEDLSTFCISTNTGGCRGYIKASTVLSFCNNAADNACGLAAIPSIPIRNQNVFLKVAITSEFAANYRIVFKEAHFKDNGQILNILNLTAVSNATQISNSEYKLSVKLQLATTASGADLRIVSLLNPVTRALGTSRFLAAEDSFSSDEKKITYNGSSIISISAILFALIAKYLF